MSCGRLDPITQTMLGESIFVLRYQNKFGDSYDLLVLLKETESLNPHSDTQYYTLNCYNINPNYKVYSPLLRVK